MQERPMSSSFEPSTALISFSGAVDEFEVDAFRERIVEAVTAVTDGTLSIDLSDVDYFPSVAVGALIQATMSNGGISGHARSEVVAAEGSIAQRVLLLSGLPHRTR